MLIKSTKFRVDSCRRLRGVGYWVGSLTEECNQHTSRFITQVFSRLPRTRTISLSALSTKCRISHWN